MFSCKFHGFSQRRAVNSSRAALFRPGGIVEIYDHGLGGFGKPSDSGDVSSQRSAGIVECNLRHWINGSMAATPILDHRHIAAFQHFILPPPSGLRCRLSNGVSRRRATTRGESAAARRFSFIEVIDGTR